VVWDAALEDDQGLVDTDVYSAFSTDNGLTWSVPQLLSTAGTASSIQNSAPRVSADGAGNWIVLWSTLDDLGASGTDLDVFSAVSTDGGATWAAPVLVTTGGLADSGADQHAHVSSDGPGVWLAVWDGLDETFKWGTSLVGNGAAGVAPARACFLSTS